MRRVNAVVFMQSPQSVQNRPREIDALELLLAAKAKSTAYCYRRQIKLWTDFLASEMGHGHNLLTADEMDAYRYLTYIRQLPGRAGKLARGSVHTKISTLHRIYGFLDRHKLVPKNIFIDILESLPEKGCRHPYSAKMIAFDDVRRLIDCPSQYTQQGVIYRAMMALLFGCGLRAREVTGIKLKDLCRTSAGTWFIVLPDTKAQEEQEQAIPEWAAERILAAAEQRRVKDKADGEGHLLVRYFRHEIRPLEYQTARRQFKMFCEEVGLPRFNIHDCRATAISKLLADGMPHDQVREFSRHASIQMVELYDKRRTAIDQAPGKKLSY